MTKVRFPREIIPLAAVTANSVISAVMLVIAVPLCIILGTGSLAPLVLLPVVLALAASIPLGIVAAMNEGTALDRAIGIFAMIGQALPSFWLGLILMIWLGLYWQLLPISGVDTWDGYVMPAIVLAFSAVPALLRLTRAGMIDVLASDYIRTARAKGVGELGIVLRHALRGGILPVVAFLGPAAAGILSGSFVIETIFQVPGLGREFVNSAFNRDYTVILGTVLLYAAMIVFFNLLVDVVQVWLNPRLKFE